MNIGAVAEASGLRAKTIRYYEEIGLVRPDRSRNGYRQFCEGHVRQLAFLSRARRLGFSIDECRALLALYEDRERASVDVKRLAEGHLADIDRKLAELVEMRETLSNLVQRCRGDDRPDCPILDGLAIR